jgi:hypothetical protein
MSKSREEVNRTAWATIDNLPQSPVSRAGRARPKSFPDMETQLRMGIDFECSLSMFLHEFYQHRDPSFFAEPPSTQLSDINRAALAGIAEWLCHRYHYPVPAWTELPECFLPQERNWFEGMFDAEFLETGREYHVGRSAPEFMRRNLLFPVLGMCRV